MTNCMSCRHTKPLTAPDGQIDFGKRVCTFGPPHMVAIPVGPGQIQLTPMFPVVGPQVCCSQHDPRLLGDEAPAADAAKPS